MPHYFCDSKMEVYRMLNLGTQNNSSQQVFDCVPMEGIIDPGEIIDLFKTFTEQKPIL